MLHNQACLHHECTILRLHVRRSGPVVGLQQYHIPYEYDKKAGVKKNTLSFLKFKDIACSWDGPTVVMLSRCAL